MVHGFLLLTYGIKRGKNKCCVFKCTHFGKNENDFDVNQAAEKV
jgi:hypothetical protein